MAKHNEIGNLGEEQARKYLLGNGYTIREVNWTFKKLEIDVIGEKDNVLIIIEVKTRSTDYFEHPEEAVNLRKIRHLVNAAHEYIMQSDWQGDTRFDVISVIPCEQSYKIEHIQDAFIPPVN